MQRPPRIRRNRMDGETVARTFRLRTEVERTLGRVARSLFDNNKTRAVEAALTEFFDRHGFAIIEPVASDDEEEGLAA